MEREAGLVEYFEYEGLPARVRKGNFPILTNKRGVDVFMHDIEKFYRESHVISMAKYTAMVTRLTRR